MESRPNNDFDIFQLVFKFEEMVKSDIDHYIDEKSFMRLLEYFEDEREYNNALVAASMAVKRFQYNIDFHLKKAEYFFHLRKYIEAEATLESALLIAPYDFDVRLFSARIFIARKKHEEAENILEEIKNGADNQELGQIYYLEGLIFEGSEEYEQMFESMKFALLCDPTNENALKKMWVCTEIVGRFEDSINLHLSIIEEDPYSYLAWYNLGQAYSCINEYDKALEAYEYSFLIEPDFELGYQDRADLFFELRRFQEALDCYNEWYEVLGPDSDLLCQIGHCYLSLGKYKKANKIFKKANRLDPYNDEIYFLLGRTYYKQGEYLSAINSYLKAIRIEGLREEYFASLASAYSRTGEYTKAHFYFQKAEEIGPDQSYIWKKHALFLYGIGEFNAALEVIEEGIENAMDPELLYCKAGFLVHGNDIPAAMDTLEEALVERYEANSTFHKLVEGVELDKDIVSLLRFFTPQNS
ncbi:tetratricopeptide repeat protein [Membranihabitans maritimus]|uniref:tetratricopeptide repeat protein n=1 Tax=Membranihabitans maritimus TaxID=2904244 RepID=UPI001F2F5764|nr:tetratricopeptide repeat protein [Membranihabitans maritimus]